MTTLNKDILWLDYETKSNLNLKEVGLDRYAKDPSTEILMLAYALNDAEPKLWLPHLNPFLPEDLREMLLNPEIIKGAWNYNFEKDITEEKLGITIPQDQWIDPSVLCAYMSLPIGLHRAGEALSIHGKKIHITGNNRPVKLFGSPSKATKKMLKNGSPPTYFKNWQTHPEQWEVLCTYCLGDVIAERDVYKAVLEFNSPMTPGEIEAWELDQRMNSNGVYIDQVFVQNAKTLAENEAKEIIEQMRRITFVENPNSRDQLLNWLQGHKYPFDSLDEEHVEKGLLLTLPAPALEVLTLKQRLGGSAYKKLESIQDRIGLDGRLRDQFLYHGAHTGRWSGRGVQLQNLYKTMKEVSDRLDYFVSAIRNGEKIESNLLTMDIIASTVRSAFAAAPGNKLVVGDLAQIESRVLAVIAKCKTMIDLYAGGHDLYKDFMAWLLKKPVKEITKDERARGKVVILGCGYQMGWEKFQQYAASFGVLLSEEDAKEAVYGFRERYPEIPRFWDSINKAVIKAVKVGIVCYQTGLVIDGRDKRMLKIKLPSGRYLHYLNPEIIREMKWGRMTESVQYTSFDQKGMSVKYLYGGLLTENIDQAMSRDLLLSGMIEAEKEAIKVGGKLTMTIHDEIVVEVPKDSSFNTETLLTCMRKVPSWGEGMGFTLAAEGWEGPYYKK